VLDPFFSNSILLRREECSLSTFLDYSGNKSISLPKGIWSRDGSNLVRLLVTPLLTVPALCNLEVYGYRYCLSASKSRVERLLFDADRSWFIYFSRYRISWYSAVSLAWMILRLNPPPLSPSLSRRMWSTLYLYSWLMSFLRRSSCSLRSALRYTESE
jgi:hypothetical protein